MRNLKLSLIDLKVSIESQTEIEMLASYLESYGTLNHLSVSSTLLRSGLNFRKDHTMKKPLKTIILDDKTNLNILISLRYLLFYGNKQLERVELKGFI